MKNIFIEGKNIGYYIFITFPVIEYEDLINKKILSISILLDNIVYYSNIEEILEKCILEDKKEFHVELFFFIIFLAPILLFLPVLMTAFLSVQLKLLYLHLVW